MSVTIFEGPDGAGKTTLAATLQRMLPRREQLKPVCVNHGPYIGERDIAIHYLNSMVGSRTSLMHPILDRSWVSEGVYGPIMRNGTRINVAQRRALERFALGCGAIIIMCLPSYEACKRTYLSRRESEYLPDESFLKRVYNEFATLIDNQVVPTFLYNYERETSRTLYLDMVHDTRQAYVNHGPGVGAFRDRTTLIVGEQVSHATAAVLFPWMSWDLRGCVGWLSDQLESWGVSERDLYWINALDDRGNEVRPGGWLERLNPRRVIALGQIAGAWVQKHRALMKHAQRYDYAHPQHWKRFHHNEQYPMKEAFES